MPTLYISGPMTGLPNHNKQAFMEAERLLEDAGYAVINPVRVCKHLSEGTDWNTYMKYDVAAMMMADGVAMLPGWAKSKGANIEISLAHKLAMPVKVLHWWLHDIKDSIYAEA